MGSQNAPTIHHIVQEDSTSLLATVLAHFTNILARGRRKVLREKAIWAFSQTPPFSVFSLPPYAAEIKGVGELT